MRGRRLLLAAALGAMVVAAWPAAAKEQKQEKTKWEFYGGPKNEGTVQGQVYLIRDGEKAWKAAGKAIFDVRGNPAPFALLDDNIAAILWVDGKKADVRGPVKIKPGVHTLVVMLAGQSVRSKDCFEFQIRCEAGREYMVQPTYEKKFFRKGTWEPYVLWRPIPPGYPKEREAKKQ